MHQPIRSRSCKRSFPDDSLPAGGDRRQDCIEQFVCPVNAGTQTEADTITPFPQKGSFWFCGGFGGKEFGFASDVAWFRDASEVLDGGPANKRVAVFLRYKLES